MTKSPTFMMIAFSKKSVRPVISTQPDSATANTTLSWERKRMPLLIPEVAEIVATKTASTTSAICAGSP